MFHPALLFKEWVKSLRKLRVFSVGMGIISVLVIFILGGISTVITLCYLLLNILNKEDANSTAARQRALARVHTQEKQLLNEANKEKKTAVKIVYSTKVGNSQDSSNAEEYKQRYIILKANMLFQFPNETVFFFVLSLQEFRQILANEYLALMDTVLFLNKNQMVNHYSKMAESFNF